MSRRKEVVMTINLEKNTGRRIGYARVSTDKQTTDQQIDALHQAGCEKVFVDDGIKATARIRPGLEQARQDLMPTDIFVVWAIDRAFRSTLDAILFLDDIDRNDIAFLSLTQNIDTRTPEGRKWFIDTASWAEYERSMISRRTKIKLEEAKKRGVVLGRPKRLPPKVIVRAHKRITEQHQTIKAEAQRLGVATITLNRGFKRMGLR